MWQGCESNVSYMSHSHVWLNLLSGCRLIYTRGMYNAIIQQALHTEVTQLHVRGSFGCTMSVRNGLRSCRCLHTMNTLPCMSSFACF